MGKELTEKELDERLYGSEKIREMQEQMSLTEYLESQDARLCPYRLDNNMWIQYQDAEWRIMAHPMKDWTQTPESILSQYGCIKSLCTAWAENRCQAVYRS